MLHKQPITNANQAMKRFLSLFLLSGIALGGYSQRVLNIDSCRALALENNKELRIAQEKINAAHYQNKAAFTNFLPKIDVMGTYMHTQKEISLLNDQQKRQSAPSVRNCSRPFREWLEVCPAWVLSCNRYYRCSPASPTV